MDCLPLDFVDYLYSFLSPKSIKNLRLVCKSFAEIGESRLFNGFEFRLYPQESRFAQLRDLSLHPTIAPRLKCLCYEFGIQREYADYSHWQALLFWKAHLYHVKAQDFSKVLPPDEKSQEDYHQIQKILAAQFTPDLGERYEEYRRWLDDQARIMAHSPEVPSTFASMLSDDVRARNHPR
ncbi:hypothetical protein GJ744_001718 [Endocarpon pusillum]|uniref:F-box domain-containing protein n=1 Tax=Endocarpon pusillum TaxID=364733 RepID=A0A8H7AGK9_9EURO|nr:hypothetical protein GJ744_001718 [Endocarpon pusillum]